MKTKQLLISCLLVVFSFTTKAQLLWKVSGNGLEKPSYIFGTHHLIDKTEIKDFNLVLKIAGDADAVVGEMDMTDMASLQPVMAKAAMMTGKTCKDLYSEEDYAFLDKEFKALLGMGLDQLGVMKPMALNTLYLLVAYQKMTGATKQPEAVDILFQKAAQENQKKVIGLETAEFQANLLFNSSTLEQQASDLLKEVKEKDKYLDLTKRLNEAYLKGDFATVKTLQKEDDSMTPEEKAILITNRNNNWMKKLPDLMKAQSCFVAVGFMHLIGDEGLVNQLKKNGYTVEPQKS